MTRQTIVQLTNELIAELDDAAARNGVSRSEIIRQAIRGHLANDTESLFAQRLLQAYLRLPLTTRDEWGSVAEPAARSASASAGDEHRGDVYWYELPHTGRRPWLILAPTAVIPALDRVIAVPATQIVRNIPTEVHLGVEDGMPCPCVLLLDALSTIRTEFCVERVTRLGPEKMSEVCRALEIATACS